MNAHASIGHNNPPSPFDDAQALVQDLLCEASNWLDGAEVTSQEEADAIAKLLDMARKAKKEADEARKVEAKPFDDGKKAVQAKYKPLIDECDRVAEVCKAANLPWLRKLEEEQRLKAQEAARIAQEQERKAQEALRAASATDLAARSAAEQEVELAKQAAAAAAKADKERAHAKGGARAMSLRTFYDAEITDAVAFARWCWENERSALIEAMQKIADQRVRANFRSMPGVTVHERKEAV